MLKDTLQESLLGFKLRSSGLVASIFNHQDFVTKPFSSLSLYLLSRKKKSQFSLSPLCISSLLPFSLLSFLPIYVLFSLILHMSLDLSLCFYLLLVVLEGKKASDTWSFLLKLVYFFCLQSAFCICGLFFLD